MTKPLLIGNDFRVLQWVGPSLRVHCEHISSERSTAISVNKLTSPELRSRITAAVKSHKSNFVVEG